MGLMMLGVDVAGSDVEGLQLECVAELSYRVVLGPQVTMSEFA
jgi:hypothetical protein